MINKNKLFKYILYAFGEIILVVIGILLALQINTWNSTKQDRLQEQEYLKNLKTDLEGSIVELDRVYNESKSTAKTTQKILEVLLSETTATNSKKLDSLVLKTISYTDAVLMTATIEDIKQSSKLYVIQNDTIRRFVATWDNNFQQVTEAESNLKMAFDNHLEYLSSISNFSRNVIKGDSPFNGDLLNTIKSKNEIENSFGQMHVWSEGISELYLEKKEQLEKILGMIEKQIATYE